MAENDWFGFNYITLIRARLQNNSLQSTCQLAQAAEFHRYTHIGQIVTKTAPSTLILMYLLVTVGTATEIEHQSVTPTGTAKKLFTP